jgi:hypothetical protein
MKSVCVKRELLTRNWGGDSKNVLLQHKLTKIDLGLLASMVAFL